MVYEKATSFGIEFMMASTIEHRAATSEDLQVRDVDEKVVRPSADKTEQEVQLYGTW